MIAESFNCAPSTISYKLKEWGIPNNERPNAFRTVNQHYFDVIDDEHKAYWFGFLIADGHVNEHAIMLGLQMRDINHVKKFAADIGSDAEIHINKDGNPAITITCRQLSRSLLTKGLNHRKSYGFDFSLATSFVPENLENHFVRGLFDGDGCVGLYRYDYLKKPQLHVGYTGLTYVCQYVAEKFGITTKPVHESDTIWTVRTGDRNRAVSIYNYLYKDATLWLDRKKEKFEEIKMVTFNDYNGNTQIIG